MTKKEMFQHMRELIKKLELYRNKKTVTMTQEDNTNLAKIFEHFVGKIQLQLWCPSCVVEYLHQIYAMYEREYPKYLATLSEKEREEETKVKVTPEEKLKLMWEARAKKYPKKEKKEKKKPEGTEENNELPDNGTIKAKDTNGK